MGLPFPERAERRRRAVAVDECLRLFLRALPHGDDRCGAPKSLAALFLKSLELGLGLAVLIARQQPCRPHSVLSDSSRPGKAPRRPPMAPRSAESRRPALRKRGWWECRAAPRRKDGAARAGLPGRVQNSLPRDGWAPSQHRSGHG